MSIMGLGPGKMPEYNSQWVFCPQHDTTMLWCFGIGMDGFCEMYCHKCQQVFYDMPVKAIDKWFRIKLAQNLTDPGKARKAKGMLGVDLYRDLVDGKLGVERMMLTFPRFLMAFCDVKLIY